MEGVVRRKRAPLQGDRLQVQEGHAPDALQHVLAYHERTKHRLERYAPGPEALDWSSQPEPFRSYAGSRRIALPLAADALQTPYYALHEAGGVAPQPVSLESIGLLLELSLGLSAWKEYGPDRWALRCNPSSGNLHPTEGYVVSRSVPGLEDGVYHYLSRDHILEQRARGTEQSPPDAPARLLIGLSSIHWREAWKYGERAFRYCQLDTGHALGALRYAAAALGWRLRLVEGTSWPEIARRLGLDRDEDFPGVEPEDAELLLEVIADAEPLASVPAPLGPVDPVWSGRANVLDPHPMYHWPVIDEVAEATRTPALTGDSASVEAYPPRSVPCGTAAATLIRQRRSAQHFDGRTEISQARFYGLLDALLPRRSTPWDVWDFLPRVHPVLFVHRVEGLAPGLYILPRRTEVIDSLRGALNERFDWKTPEDCPAHLPFFQLAAAGCGQLAKTIHCHQAIATDSAFALGMLTEYADVLKPAPWRYRQLYWEAGLLGQVLYLEAEALGLRGTGIGCYFDDTFHELLGLSGQAFQSLYHFTVGYPLTDTRILTLPPYPARP
ncbi:nitroreductase family protein [Methylococcus sp. EFPC2]|uniref:nitroreductase family protein n=1 Tax=Methylococcus sp. EFPC2 TaxID=2812648 RepID=UPI001967CA5D|nr:nitroreductase family protein [Methylococcus sp. EFPC2]QSA99271.1 nitroreductase family protein [Methylococcus sp. EFPC2]